MSDYELVIVSCISTLGFIGGLWIINQNWFKREEVKYKYQMKRAKLSKALKTPVKDEPSTLDTVKGLVPLLRSLEPEQISALADRFLGNDLPGEEGEGDLMGAVLEYAEKNPELAKSFIEGLTKGKGVKKDDGFITQE